MSNDNKLANPLQEFIKRATKLPREGQIAERQRRKAAGAGGSFILCDVSASMAEAVGAKTKWELLREALLARGIHQEAVVIAFNSSVTPIPFASSLSATLPAPAGSTALHLALEYLVPSSPSRTIVISDGEPDDAVRALSAASRASGIIDVIYVGHDGNSAAKDFMRRLARAGGGSVSDVRLRDASPQLAPTIRGLLHS